jgi:cobalt/nickel transport system permease protein
MTFRRGSFYALAPLVLFPTLVGALAELPYKLLLKRFAVALPFALFGGISAILFDSNGIIICLTILLKTYLCVMSALILVGTTRFTEISRVMKRVHIPAVIVSTIELTYRYIGVLLEEASDMSRAYHLRSCGKSIAMRDMGSFLGQLVLKSFDRAERVYAAMKCRGY